MMRNATCFFAMGLFALALSGWAQTEGATWASVTIQKKLSDRFIVGLQPELRWSDGDLERRMVETELEYSPLKFLSTVITHRYTSEETNNDGTLTYHRMAFDLKGQFEVRKWEPEVRLRYTNIKDFTADGGANFLRYKVGLAYDIPKFKGKPEVAAEAFQELDGNTIRKMRYSLGGRYKFNKTHSVALAYKRDDFKTKEKFINMVDVNYRVRL